MKRKGAQKGGLSKQRQSTTSGGKSQAESASEKGIRLLPSVTFHFTEHGRRTLTLTLKQSRKVADRLLDAVEERIARYLTDKLLRSRASSAAELRKRIQRLQDRAEWISAELTRCYDLSRPFDYDSQLIGSVINARWSRMHSEKSVVLPEAIHACDRLAEACKLVLEDDESLIAIDLQSVESDGVNGMQPVVAYLERRRAENRRRLVSRRGAPKKSDDVDFIADVARLYEDIAGKRATSDRTTVFYGFIQSIFQQLPLGKDKSETDRRRLIEQALANVRRS